MSSRTYMIEWFLNELELNLESRYWILKVYMVGMQLIEP